MRSARLAARLSPALARVRPPYPPCLLGVHGHALGRGPVAVEPVEHGACGRALRVGMLQGGAVEPAALPALKHGENGEEPVLITHLELLEPVEPERHARARGAPCDGVHGGAGRRLHAPAARVGLADRGAHPLVLVLDLDRHLAVAAAVRPAANAEEADPVRVGDRVLGGRVARALAFTLTQVLVRRAVRPVLAVAVPVQDVNRPVVDPETEAAHERGLDVPDDAGRGAALGDPYLDGVDRTVVADPHLHGLDTPDHAQEIPNF